MTRSMKCGAVGSAAPLCGPSLSERPMVCRAHVASLARRASADQTGISAGPSTPLGRERVSVPRPPRNSATGYAHGRSVARRAENCVPLAKSEENRRPAAAPAPPARRSLRAAPAKRCGCAQTVARATKAVGLSATIARGGVPRVRNASSSCASTQAATRRLIRIQIGATRGTTGVK